MERRLGASLPNITGGIQTFVDIGRSEGWGAIRRINDGSHYPGTSTYSGTRYNELAFYASWSSSIYQDNATVHPESLSTVLLIKYV